MLNAAPTRINSGVQFESARVLLVEHKIFVQNLSPHEAAEGADFHKLDPDPVGVAEGVAKIKVAYNLVLLSRSAGFQ